MSNDYDYSVFINCPFDSQYQPLFESIIFTIFICGFKPRCALEHDDASESRIEKINNIIVDCKYGFHDISRTEVDPISQLRRFNIPLELGMFLGCKRFSSGRKKEKTCIIFDKISYRYQQFISDIAGQDIKFHDNNPKMLIKSLRNMFLTNNPDLKIHGANFIIKKYEAYQLDKKNIKINLDLDDDDDELTYSDHVKIIQQWLRINL